MDIRTLILDDDANSRFAACTALSEFPEIKIAGHFGKISDLFSFLETSTADLLFLDIELDGETGFSAAERLKNEYPELMIVFLTGHSSYAIDGYGFQPINFLTKPINREKLAFTINEVKRRMEKNWGQASSKLMFHLLQGYKILDVRDICYIERFHRKNYLYTEDSELRIAGYTVKELDEMLSEHGFFLCHQSYILSLYRVTSVRAVGRQLYEAELRGCEKPVPVSRNRYEELLLKLKQIGIKTL